MNTLLVVDGLDAWPSHIPGASPVTASDYLAAPDTPGEQQVVNLCACNEYQDRAYYVSLLAEARGHSPLPDVKTLEDLQSGSLTRMLAAELEPMVGLAHAPAGAILSIDSWFGQDPSGRYTAVSEHLFRRARAPLLRADFERRHDGWQLRAVRTPRLAELPANSRAGLAAAATAWMAGGRAPSRTGRPPRSQPALAILHDRDAPEAPSNPAALARFIEAAHRVGLDAQVIDRHAIDRLGEFDALFIRDTTNVTHYTYAFSRAAAAQGLVVIDDPDSILKCTNKVYLNELMARHRVPVPRTLTVDAETVDRIIPTLGLPCILKQPDSAFSLGVRKVENAADLHQRAEELLRNSAFIVAQEFLPTTFDWRVGVLDGRPLFVCQYFMAPGHWQVIKRETEQRVEGRTLALAVGEAPEIVISTALRAASLIGDGLYGVDLKQVGNACYLIEVNDNPNIDAGNEDNVLKEALYREVMGVFARRIRDRRRALEP